MKPKKLSKIIESLSVFRILLLLFLIRRACSSMFENQNGGCVISLGATSIKSRFDVSFVLGFICDGQKQNYICMFF